MTTGQRRGATPVSFGELIEQADYLVIQPPLTSDTQDLIGEAELQRMEPGAVLINTVRDFAASEAVRVLTGNTPLPPVNAVQPATGPA